MDEFFAQGDLEEKAGVTVSPFMSRDTTSIPDSQFGFFKYLVVPMYESFTDSFEHIEHRRPEIQDAFSTRRPSMPPVVMNQLMRNQQYWKPVNEPAKRNSLCAKPERGSNAH